MQQLCLPVRRGLPRDALILTGHVLAGEPGRREDPSAVSLCFFLGTLGQGLSLGITQPLLTRNIAENPGQDLGKER